MFYLPQLEILEISEDSGFKATLLASSNKVGWNVFQNVSSNERLSRRHINCIGDHCLKELRIVQNPGD